MAPPLMLYTIASDNFNRANANPIGGNWTTEGGTNALQIVSNAVETTVANTASFAYWNANSFPNDQWVQLTATLLAVGDSNPAFNTTLRSAKANPRTFYQFYGQHAAASAASVVQKVVSGTVTSLANNGQAWSSGDIMLGTAIGTQLTQYRNGVQNLQTTDSALTSGVVGISARPTSAIANVTVDDFSAGGFLYNQLMLTGAGT